MSSANCKDVAMMLPTAVLFDVLFDVLQEVEVDLDLDMRKAQVRTALTRAFLPCPRGFAAFWYGSVRVFSLIKVSISLISCETYVSLHSK